MENNLAELFCSSNLFDWVAVAFCFKIKSKTNQLNPIQKPKTKSQQNP